jgi:hypothetical protein
VARTYYPLASLGAGKTGLAIGYRLIASDGTVAQAFTVVGVAETSVPGNYVVTGGVSLADAFRGRIEWGTAGAKLAEEPVNPDTATDPLANPLGGYASGTAGGALQRIGTASVAVTSPVTQAGDVSIIQGDSYLAADNRAIEWTDAGGIWPDLAGATALLTLHGAGAQSLGLTVVTPSGVGKRLRLELTAGASGGMLSRTTPYSIRAALADGSTVTLARGTWTVLPF